VSGLVMGLEARESDVLMDDDPDHRDDDHPTTTITHDPTLRGQRSCEGQDVRIDDEKVNRCEAVPAWP
jgi:hypothetical protein